MAQKYYGYSEKEILQHVSSEYQSAINVIQSKRQLFRDRLKDYTNITSDKSKIYVRLIYSVMQTLMALHYSDEMSVEFAGRQLGADEVAENLQHLAEFDYEEMGLDEIMYHIEWDRNFFGKAFLCYDHWDNVRQCPVYRRISPMAAVLDIFPDPLYGPRFYQFELEVDSAYLSKDRGYDNQNKLTKLIDEQNSKGEKSQGRNVEIEQNKQALAQVREFTNSAPGSAPSYRVPVHYCYTTMNNEKYFIVTAMQHGVCLKMEKIEPVFKEEIRDNVNIEFPVIEFELSPLDGDPFGVCIPDLIADKQRALQLLLGLEKTKAVRQAHGGKFLVDTQAINIRNLIQETEGASYIPLKAGFRDIAATVIPVAQDQINGDISFVQQQLTEQAHSDIGIDTRGLGASGGREMTANENETIQRNSNLKQVLSAKIKKRGLKRFYQDWYKRYYDNFKRSSVKNIIINSRIGSRPLTLKRKDIATGYDIDVKVVSKAEQEDKMATERLGFQIILENILLDPQAAEISKVLAKRKMARLNGATAEEAKLYFPSVTEERAMMDVELLNYGEDAMPIQDMSEDHLTWLVVLPRAVNSPKKRKAIEQRRMAYVLSGQAQAQPMMGGGTGQQTTAQLTNSAIQESQGVSATSLQDVQ